MKTYLLICFILLFYSINSITKENCAHLNKTCTNYCGAYPPSFQENCKIGCSRKCNECYKRATN